MARPAPQRLIDSLDELRAARADAEPNPSHSHGTRYGYRLAGCRCEACRAWEAAYQRDRRARRKASRQTSPTDTTREDSQ